MVRNARAPCLLLALAASPALLHGASPCTVPGSHSTIQQAVDDPSCTTIQLASQTFVENVLVQRSLTVAGAAGGGSTLQGQLSVAGSGVLVTVFDLQVSNGCPESMSARNGAQLDGLRVTATHSSALGCGSGGRLFSDGFESGGTGSWS